MGKSLEKSPTEYLTTGTIAEYCGVSRVTVLRWIGKGYLAAFRLPEGHYRIHRDDFGKFLTKHGMPVRKRMFEESHGGQAND